MKTFILVMSVTLVFLCAASQSLSATFEFVSGEGKNSEAFLAKTTDGEAIKQVRAELAKPLAERKKFILGPIDRGNEGYNKPWHWHFVRDKWKLAEMSMELCDGKPSYVETNLDEWLAKIGTFCPWTERVSREIEISIQ
jgi:hypothetical protein